MVKLGKTSTFTDNHCWSNHAKSLNLAFLLVKSTTVSSCWWNPSLLLLNFTFWPLKSQVFMVQSWFLLLQSPFLLLQSFKKAASWGEVVAYFLRAKRPPKERRSQDWSQENTKNWLGVPKITKIIGFLVVEPKIMVTKHTKLRNEGRKRLFNHEQNWTYFSCILSTQFQTATKEDAQYMNRIDLIDICVYLIRSLTIQSNRSVSNPI